jgi:DNA-binding beta-propeller fold protein YncE
MKSLFLALVYSLSLFVSAEEPRLLRLTTTIQLPGVKGRFDHFSIDTNGHRLFVAALGNDTLEIVEIAAGKHLKSITGLHKPTGVLYLSNENQIAVANGDDGTLKLFDGRSYELVKSVAPLDDADNVRMDPKTKTIFVGYGEGALAVIDATTAKQVGNIKIPAHPESFQLEKQGNRIFVNVPGAKQIVVIDRDKRIVTATWPMKEFQSNFPMALDEANKRLFIGCRNPPRLVVFDTVSGKPVTNIAISGDTDDLFYDGTLKRIYLSCGEGFVDVIDHQDAHHYQTRNRIPSRSGARTSFFSPELNEFYLAIPQRGQESAEIRIFKPFK